MITSYACVIMKRSSKSKIAFSSTEHCTHELTIAIWYKKAYGIAIPNRMDMTSYLTLAMQNADRDYSIRHRRIRWGGNIFSVIPVSGQVFKVRGQRSETRNRVTYIDWGWNFGGVASTEVDLLFTFWVKLQLQKVLFNKNKLSGNSIARNSAMGEKMPPICGLAVTLTLNSSFSTFIPSPDL